ncbi:MAG: hypothetical protein JXB46_07525, partial [Candidatus Eisenbacteria bacterium]|nr:hypothetical protein [Candidatus Eisenbacteria bacterium]
NDHFAPSAFIESDEGGAPGPGRHHAIDRAGGTVTVPLSSDWLAELGGIRCKLERRDPYWGLPQYSDHRTQIRADLHARATGPAVALDIFHTQSWLESDAAGGAAHSEREGLFAELEAPWGLDALRVCIERRSAMGWLLGGDHDALGGMAEVSRSFCGAGREVTANAGLSVLDGVACPSGTVVVTDRGHDDVLWSARVGYRERQPTALERFMRPVSVPSYDGSDQTVRGTTDLDPEGAALLGGSIAWPGILSGVGMSGDVVLAIAPIVLARSTPGDMHPVNAPSEAGGSVTIWAAIGDTSHVEGDIEVALMAVDAGGALSALSPLPVVSARAAVGLPVRLFEDYLQTRWELSVAHESGLSRGPWRGLMEDNRTTVRLTVAGSAGSARVFASLDNVFRTDSARIPGADPGEVVLTVGFSWTFID